MTHVVTREALMGEFSAILLLKHKLFVLVLATFLEGKKITSSYQDFLILSLYVYSL